MIRLAVRVARAQAELVLIADLVAVMFPAEDPAAAAQALAKKNDCFKCHAIDKTKKGPSYQKISVPAFAPSFDPVGVVAVWSATASPDLMAVLTSVLDETWEQVIPVRLGNRETTYHLYLGIA